MDVVCGDSHVGTKDRLAEHIEVEVVESSDLPVPRGRLQSGEFQDGIIGSVLNPASNRLLGEDLRSVVDSYVRYYAYGDSHTARAKRYDLQHFLEFLAPQAGSIDALQVSHWTLQSTQDFIDYRLQLGEAPATVSRRLATIKHFGRTLAERIPGYINPAREVKGPRLQTSCPRGLSAEETSLLVEVACAETTQRPECFAGWRNRFLLELLLATGLRADEVRLLVLAQFSPELQWLKNVRTKGRKFRNVYLEKEIRGLAAEYLERREAELIRQVPAYVEYSHSEKSRFPVLISRYGAKLDDPVSFGLSPKTVWRIISSFGLRAQARFGQSLSNLHPHKLRHTFAHGLLDSSKDVRLVAQALGHSDVRTTMRYTERTEEEIAFAIEAKAVSERR